MSVLVTVGMPVYNGARWLEATMASVLAQRDVEVELVISDNASTDDTERLCRDYAAREPRLQYHRNPENVGVANNFTKAFKLSRSPYFKWMSCGDSLDPYFLARCLSVLLQRPEVALVYPVTRLFESDPATGVDAADNFDLDVPDPVERFKTYLRHVKLNNIMHGVYRSEMLSRTRLYSPFLAADVNMIAELMLQGRAVQLDAVMNFRRSHPETMSRFFDRASLRAMYAPKAPATLKYQSWVAFRDYLTAPLRAERLTLTQRARAVAFVSRMALWRRDVLLHEIVHAGQSA